MPTAALSTTVDASNADVAADPAVKQHQQDHDVIHGIINTAATVLRWNPTTQLWDTRPAGVPYGVVARSTNDPAAPAPHSQAQTGWLVGDTWDAHPDGTVGRGIWDGSSYRQTAAVPVPITFAQMGTLQVTSGTSRIALPASPTGSWLLTSITAAVGTAPTGAAIIVDVNKNGTSLFSLVAKKPTIAVSTTVDVTPGTDAATTLFSTAGDYLTVDVDQVGSGTPGSDLTITVWLRAN